MIATSCAIIALIALITGTAWSETAFNRAHLSRFNSYRLAVQLRNAEEINTMAHKNADNAQGSRQQPERDGRKVGQYYR